MREIRATVFQSPGGHNAPAQRIVTHRLLRDRAHCPTGSRYMTRRDVQRLFLGLIQHAIVRNDGSQRYPKQARPIRAHLSTTRLRIGCHVWSGDDLITLRHWAMGWPE